MVVNTCGFIDAAIDESLQTIGEALERNGKVIVTGCLGARPERILERHPSVLKVTGPQTYAEVVSAVHEHLPPQHDPFLDLVPPQGVRLTPRHYAYLKISEGCNNKCSFCIIPALRGKLASRRIDEVLREAERLAAAGVRELLVISQDTSAYGADIRYAPAAWRDEEYRTRFIDLARGLGTLGIWVRLHYVYPYPHVDEVIPLMAERRVLPYLDIPFQHGSPSVLKRMRRPAHSEDVLRRIAAWRQQCPGPDAAQHVHRRVSPGRPSASSRSCSTGWRRRSSTASAASSTRRSKAPPPTPSKGTCPRRSRRNATPGSWSARRPSARHGWQGAVGTRMRVLVDAVSDEGAIARSEADAPEIDGVVRIAGAKGLRPGDWADVEITASDTYDLSARLRAAPGKA